MLTLNTCIRNTSLCVVLLLLGSQAFALPITWRFDDVLFADGGRIEGFFTFEWPETTNILVPVDDFNIMVSGGNEVIFPDVTYNPDVVSLAFYSANPASPSLPPLGRFVFNLDAPTPFGRERSLRMAPTLPLDGSFDVVPLITVFDLPLPGGQGREECFNCAPSRLITSGSIFIPEPNTIALLVFGFVGIILMRWKIKT